MPTHPPEQSRIRLKTQNKTKGWYTMSIQIIPMREPDVEEISRFMARSFEKDPLYAYFVPEQEARMAFMTGFFAFRLRYALNLGKTFTTPDKRAVAAWIPPDTHILPEHLEQFGGIAPMMQAGQEAAGRVMAFSDFSDRIEKEYAPMPHWHLSPIAVDPIFWNKGYAGALLREMLARFDGDKQFCYLETQTAENRKLYEHMGFVVVKEDVLPGSTIPHYAMLRSPALPL